MPEISQNLNAVIEWVNARVIATRRAEEEVQNRQIKEHYRKLAEHKKKGADSGSKPLPPQELLPAKPIGWDSIVKACQNGIPVGGSLSLIRPAEAVKIGANLLALTGEKFLDPDSKTGLQPHCQTAHSHGLAILPFMHAASELVHGAHEAAEKILTDAAKHGSPAPTANFAHVMALITQNHKGIDEAELNLLELRYVAMQTKAVRHLIV